MKFGHVGLTVRDIDEATEFYRKAFGFEPFFKVERRTRWISDITGYGDAHLMFQHMRLESGMHLELIQYLGGTGRSESKLTSTDTDYPGHAHLCLLVDDIESTIIRVLDCGGRLRSRRCPAVIGEGPNMGDRVVYMSTPDAHIIELVEKAKK